MIERNAILSGFGEGWRLRILFQSYKKGYHLSIMETTEEIWNNLEALIPLIGKDVIIEITGYKVTKITENG